jgi:hypothetical protein
VEEIPFDRIRPAKATAQEKKFTDMQTALQSADKSTIVGRWVCLEGGGAVDGGGCLLPRLCVCVCVTLCCALPLSHSHHTSHSYSLKDMLYKRRMERELLRAKGERE